jgi:hypothetical protein
MAENIGAFYGYQDGDSASPTWTDEGLAVKSGAEGLGASVASGVRAVSEDIKDPILAPAAKFIQSYLNDASDEDIKSMSPVARERINAAVTDPEFYKHPVSSALLKGLNMSPMLAASLMPGGWVADAAAFGGINAAQGINDMYKLTDTKSDEDLQKEFPYYASLRSMGMDESDARAQSNEKLRGLKPLINFAVGAAAGALGPIGGIARGLSGEAAGATIEPASGIVSRALSGGVEGAIAMGGQGAVSEATMQSAKIEAGQQKEFNPDEIANAALQGAAMGGVPGALLGGLFKGHGEEKVDTHTQPPKGYGTGNAPPPPTNVEVGNEGSAPTRSEQNYPKGNEASATQRDPSVQTVDVLSPDAAQAVAMATKPEAPAPAPAPAQPAQQQVPPAVAAAQERVKNAQPAPAEVAPARPVQQAPQPVADAAQRVRQAQHTPEPPGVDATKTVVSGANSSAAPNGPVDIDKNLPRFVPGLVDKNGQPWDIHASVALHERVERDAIQKWQQDFVAKNGRPPTPAETNDYYQNVAHPKIATPAERQMVESAGVDWKKYSEVVDGSLSHIEREPNTNPPKDTITNPEADIGKKPTGRVLKPTDKESLDVVAAQNRVLADNAKRAAAEPEAEAPRGTKHRSEAEKEARVSAETAAQQIIERHAPAANESDDAVIARAKSMVAEAEQHGVKIPKLLRGDKTAPMTILKEASDLVTRTGNKAWAKTKKYRADNLLKFRSREVAARSGAVDEVLAERRSEGDAVKRVSQGDVEAKGVTPEVIEGGAAGESRHVQVRDSETKVGDSDLRGVSARTEEAEVKDKTGKTVKVERAQAASGVRKVELSEAEKAELVKKYGMTPKVADAKARVDAAAAKADTNPTPAQKEAGNYEKGHVTIHGMDVTIENPRGSIRTGKDANGKPWVVKMPDHYGYIRRTEGMDGDHVDTFVGPHPESPHAFVVDQVNADTRAPDEHKAFLGYENAREALNAYERAFSDGRAAERVGGITAMSIDEFKKWKDSSATKKPLEPAEPIAAQGAALKRTVDSNGVVHNGTASAKPIKSYRLGDILPKFDMKGYGPLFSFIRRKIIEGAGDTQVHLFDKEDLYRLWGRSEDEPLGFYNSGLDGVTRKPTHDEFIALDGDLDHESAVHALWHEAVHVLTFRKIIADEGMQRSIESVMREIKNSAFKEDAVNHSYAFTNAAEFLSEAMSNKKFQDFLRRTPLSKELASDLGLKDWRKYSVWSAFVEKVRSFLRLPGNTYNALEAAMSLTERAATDKLPDARKTDLNRRLMQIVPTGAALRPADAVREAIDGAKDVAGRLASHPVDTMVGAVRQLADHPAATPMLKRIGNALTTNDQHRQWIDRHDPELGAHARNIYDMIEKQGVHTTELKQDGNQLIADMVRAQEANPERFARFSELVNEQTMYGVDASAKLGEGRNSYLRLSKENQAKFDKGKLDPSEANSAHWAARGAHEDLSNRYQGLVGADPRFRDLQERLFKFFHDAQSDMVKGHIAEYLRAAGVSDPAVREARAESLVKGKATAELKENLTNEFDENIAKQILDAKKLAGSEGPYSPLMRHGDYVVGGKYKVEQPKNAIRTDGDSTWEFATRKEAHQFAESTGLAYDVSSMYRDPVTGERTTKSAETQTHSPAQSWEVHVQRQHTEFHETAADAKAAQKSLHETGLLEAEPYVEHKQDYIQAGNEIGAGALNKMMNSLEKTEEFRRATPAQQADMRRSLQEAALATRAGNRIQSRRLPRRRVQGASEDLPRNLWIYNESQAAYRAKTQYRPQIEEALQGMQKWVTDQRYDTRNALDPRTLQRSQTANEITERARAQDPNEYTGAWTDWTRRVTTWSYIDRMMRPSHLILHQTHLPMITAPHMAGRHGALQTYTTMMRTWKQAMRSYKAGAADVKGSVLDKFHEGTDYQRLMKDSFSKSDDGARVGKMLDTLAEIGLIHPASGIEVAKYQPSRQLGGALGKVDHFINRMDSVFRHATNATEAINRYVGAVTAYRLEYGKRIAAGMDEAKAHAAATEYARETIANTQGFYSATNAAPIFKNKYLRPFLQFKQFPQMMYHLLISNAAKAFSKKEDRVQAAASLLAVLGAHTMMTGLLGGLPLEAAKIGGMITKGLGVTDGDWQDVERAAYDKAVEMFGKEGAELVMHGVSRQLFGVDLHHRLGLNSFFTFGLPEKLDKQHISTFLFDQALGAPEGLAEDTFSGINKMMNGDIMGGAAKAFPSQFLRDQMRAMSGGTDKYKYSAGETAARVLGFTPTGEAERGERTSDMVAQRGEYNDKKNALIKGWVGGTDKAGAWAAIQKFNASLPPAARITMSQLQQAKTRQTAANAPGGKNYMGMSFNKQNQFIADRDKADYAPQNIGVLGSSLSGPLDMAQQMGAHANWAKFEQEARPSTNIEDDRNRPKSFKESYDNFFDQAADKVTTGLFRFQDDDLRPSMNIQDHRPAIYRRASDTHYGNRGNAGTWNVPYPTHEDGTPWLDTRPLHPMDENVPLPRSRPKQNDVPLPRSRPKQNDIPD